MSSLLLKQRWKVATADNDIVAGLARETGIPEGLATFLVLRGITDPDQALEHLTPRLSQLSDPFSMADMDRALERIRAAIRAGEKIGIFGDYDADGVTASALLYLFFQEIGVKTQVYTPHRENDGYGLNRIGIDRLGEQGCSLIITVDCGITALEEVKYAREQGIDVIITDHHEPGSCLPEAVAVLDPKRGDCAFPFKHLAGVGVAFCLVRALRTLLHREGFFTDETPAPNLKKYLDIVALGTVSDVVPLLGDNRILVSSGLEVATVGARPGISALKSVSSVSGTVSSMHLAFRLGPRINAAGRMDHAGTAFRLLVTDNEKEAMVIARELEAFNAQRQTEERIILRDALSMVQEMGSRDAYVLASDRWRKGVVGIVASRIMEKVARPVVLLSVDGDEAVGSGRAPEELDLYSLLSGCSECLERFGGHRAAAGMKLSVSNISRFQQMLSEISAARVREVDFVPSLSLDARVTVDQLVHPSFAETYRQLEPFGPGYRAPLFALHGFRVRHVRTMGKGHLKVILEPGNNGSDAYGSPSVSGVEIVGWGHGDKADLPWEELEVACEPGINVWNGRRTLQLKLKDARMPEG